MRSSIHQTKRTLQNHIDAFGRGDVDGIMQDFADDAIVYLPDATLHGKTEIRPLFEHLVSQLPPGSDLNFKRQVTDADLAYLVWSGESATLRVPFAVDTLLMRDGKILRQTFAARMEPKPQPPP